MPLHQFLPNSEFSEHERGTTISSRVFLASRRQVDPHMDQAGELPRQLGVGVRTPSAQATRKVQKAARSSADQQRPKHFSLIRRGCGYLEMTISDVLPIVIVPA